MPTLFTLDKLAAYLESEEIEFFRDDEEQSIHFAIEGDHGVFDVLFELSETDGYLLCAVQPPLVFKPTDLPRLYEATSRANYLLPLGAFQINVEELMLLFVLGVPIEESDLTLAQLETLLAACLECADTYQPAFEAILEGAEINQAIERAENPDEPPG